MTKHKAIISNESNSFYSMIVRIDKDGQEHVLRGYKSRFFKTLAGAQKSTQKYISQL